MKRRHSGDRFGILFGAVALALGAAAWSFHSSPAQEPAAEDAAAAEPRDLIIPEGDAAELDEFIQKIAEQEAQGATEEELIADAKRVLDTIREAAVLMIASEPKEELLLKGHRYRLMALQGLGQLGDDVDKKRFEAAVDETIAAKQPEVVLIGWQSLIYATLGQWDALDDDAKQAFAKRVIDAAKDGPPRPLDVQIIMMVAQNLERVDDPFVLKLLEATVPLLKESKDEDVQLEFTESNLEGMLRRLTLPGNTMEVFGDLLGGGEIDWKSYRGKVVLVDFSATWCPPCIEEAPNVLNMYNLYKDKGFDVVAVSLDRTPDNAKEYVKDNGIQWATVFPAKEEDRYWNHPLVRHYGVTGIPTAILLDKEGKVVHMNARGPLLQQELERLLGEPAKEAAAAPAADAAAG